MLQNNLNLNFWTLPNFISIFRMILVIPLIYFLNIGDVASVLIIFLLAYLSDIADGYIARKTNNISEWGKIIDPLADKVFVVTAAIMMTWSNYLPLWFTVLVFSRDLLILIAGIYATRKLKYTLPSNYTGKVAVVCIGVSMIFALLQIKLAFTILMFLAIFMMALSLFSYSKRLIKELRKI